MVERGPEKAGVGSSILLLGTIFLLEVVKILHKILKYFPNLFKMKCKIFKKAALKKEVKIYSNLTVDV